MNSNPLQPLGEFEIHATYKKLSVLLWNISMTLFCILSVLFAVNKIVEGKASIGILFFLVAGVLIPMHFKACCSVFGGKICIYEDHIIYIGCFGHKVVKFNNAFIMVNSPRFAGGKVLYFTENNQNSFLKRLRTIFLLRRVMIIHIWMLSDLEVNKLEKLLSNLSRRPEFTLKTIGILQPFYLPNRSEST